MWCTLSSAGRVAGSTVARCTTSSHRQQQLVVARRSSGGDNRRRSERGFDKKNRRRGRPAWLRSPDDTPLRDGNRDRLLGLLTDRAVRTLLVYLMELNITHYQWLAEFLRDNPIPFRGDGNWDDVSGETFLRKLLGMPIEEVRYMSKQRSDMYNNTKPLGIDPRNIAQRIMEIRSQIAKEWTEELKMVSEENALLMREAVLSSFSLESLPVADPATSGGGHPELDMQPDDSAGGGDD